MALDTLYIFLQYIINNLVHDNGGVFLVDAHIARLLIKKINDKIDADIPYPMPYKVDHIEYLIPGGAKLGRSKDYYIKAYSKYDIANLVKALW